MYIMPTKKKQKYEVKGRLRADATKILQGVPVNVKHKHVEGTVHKHPVYFNERGGVKRHPIKNHHPEDRNYSAWEIAVGEL